MTEIETLGQLIRAISMANFGGYEASLEVDIKQEHSGVGFLIIRVTPVGARSQEIVEDYVGSKMFGEFWFWADDTVMQVL